MKNIYILFLLGVVVTTLSCEDGNKNYTEEFDSVYYYLKEGVNEFDFYSVNSAKVQTITVGRGGHGLNGVSTINLVPFTQAEMDEYNATIDGDYKLLAPEYYDMPATVAFEDGVEYRNVDVVFKGNMSELAKTGEYMLPIRLEADNGTVNDNKNIIYFKPNIIVPSIITDPTGVHVIRMEEGKREKQSFELAFYLDVKNEWDLKLRIENNEDELEKAVRQYNETMGVDYLLLPKENRSFESTILFPAGEALASSFVEVNNNNLMMDDYLLPIIPKKVVGMPFDVREAIPEDYIVMPASVDFDDSDLSKDVKITFKKEVGELDEDKEYVWGIRVYVDGFPVSEIFMKPRIATPVVTMESKEYKHILILDQGEKKASYGFNLSLDVINQWEFTVEFEENETALKAAVDKYNADKGTSYTLLPKGNCVLSSSEFTQEDNEKLVTATLSGDGLTLDKDYLYPIIPIGCGNSPFEVKEKITYVHVIMETKVESISDLRSINLEANMLKASATDGGNNVGNLLAYNNYWQSIWSPNGGKNDPKIDPVYGVYLDIDFSNKPLSQAFSFNYLPRNWPNAVPNEIVVYAGTSNDDLKKIGELKYEDNQLPFADKTWIGRVSEEDLSKLSLYSLKESGATLVRLSFISSRDKTYSNNSVKNILGYDYTKWNNSGDYPCVALQQLKIYGK